MQEILVDQEQVYEGVCHLHWEIGAMWVVTGYRGKEPITETCVASTAPSVTIDAMVTEIIYTGDHQSALCFVPFLSSAHPAKRRRP
jgi:hypothetical protein